MESAGRAEDEHSKPFRVSLLGAVTGVVIPAGADVDLCPGTFCGSEDNGVFFVWYIL